MQSNTHTGSLAGKFEGFGAAPSDALWGNIEAALQEKEKKRRGIIWWWLGGASAAAIVVILVMVNNSNPNSNQETLPIISHEESSNEDGGQTEENILVYDEEDELIKSDTENENQIEFKNEGESQNNGSLIVKSQEYKTHSEDLQNLDEEIQKDDMNELTSISIGLIDRTAIHQLDSECEYPLISFNELSPKQINKPWEIGFNIGYWTGAGSLSLQKLESDVPPTTVNTNTTTGTTLDYTESINGNSSPLVSGSVKKNINISAYFGKYINERWSWRVGLDYARTTFTSNYYPSNSFQNTAPLNLSGTTAISAIGIPISMQYDIVKRKRYKLRAAFTMINEIPIFQNFKSNSTVSSLESKQTTSGYMGGWQFGISNDIRVGENLFLNLTPGYRFYSMQFIKSSIPLAKKNHWVGGTVGLTWQL